MLATPTYTANVYMPQTVSCDACGAAVVDTEECRAIHTRHHEELHAWMTNAGALIGMGQPRSDG